MLALLKSLVRTTTRGLVLRGLVLRGLVLCGLVLFVTQATPAWSASPPRLDSAPRSLADLDAAELETLGRSSANPFVSFLPAGATPDLRYWRAVMKRRAETRRPAPKGVLTVAETEPNDTAATADLIAGFGTGAGESGAAEVTGSFAAAPPPAIIGPFGEDEGSIPLASDTGLSAGASVRIEGTIGDGPHGSGGTGTGDHDFFRIPGVLAGQLIIVDVDTDSPFDPLDPFIALYDGDGDLVVLNEDGDASVSFDSFVAVAAPFDGDYYLSVAGSLFPFAAVLADPFDPSTGFGVGSEGDYEVTIALEDGDADWFAFDLEPCDILGVNLAGAGSHLALRDPEGTLMVASTQELSGVFPPASPLPGGGRASLAFVARRPGRYTLRAFGSGGPDYTLELRVLRNPGEAIAESKRIFVDFDGATVDPSIFGGTPGMAVLSPLSSFLADWGLSPADEDAVIDATLASLRENLLADPARDGPNIAFDIELLDSRDHADPFGAPDVTRLIIGGSVGELGIPTIGIAESIDPGNLETAETAVVLLDLLSGPAPDPNSLNTIARAPGVGMVELVGHALGTIAAHEAGHVVGNFHTDLDSPLATIMDRGGNLPGTLGLGIDGVFGSADDPDVDFAVDRFQPSEGFAGGEDTLAVVACGCTTSAGIFGDGFETADLSRWSAVVLFR